MVKLNRLKLLGKIALLLVALVSCDHPPVFEQNAEIPNNVWTTSQRVKLNFEITDTVSAHNFYLNVRNTDEYPYSNLYVFVTTVFPNNKRSVDTVSCVLADETGQWLGRGTGFVFETQQVANKILYAYNKRFPLAGEYAIYIEQAMRRDSLPGIMNVGLRIEKQPKE